MEHEPRKSKFSWWAFLPFEQPAVFALLCLVAPGALAAYLLSQREFLSGSALLVTWLVAMGALGIWAHRRRYVRLWVTGLLVAVVLIACIVVLRSTGGS
jgi:hypothetical protein